MNFTNALVHFKELRLAVSACALLPAVSVMAQDKMHQLPAEKNAVVIVFDYVGGFTPPPVNDDPHMVIRADGSLTLGNRFKENARIESKISRDELQELLRLAIDECNVFAFDAAKVKQEIADKAKKVRANGIIQLAPVIADAPTTVIKVHADGKQVETKYYALSFAARTHKDVAALQKLQKLAERLQAVAERLKKDAG